MDEGQGRGYRGQGGGVEASPFHKRGSSTLVRQAHARLSIAPPIAGNHAHSGQSYLSTEPKTKPLKSLRPSGR